jgi:hypothetical protein
MLLALVALGSCTFKPNPDKDKFNCTADADCGPDHVCVVQKATGKGICFAASECHPETCNGKDDDCDGVVDDNIAAVGTACPTAGLNICFGQTGAMQCINGALVCVGQVLVQTESCDGVTDLDCDGLVGCADPDCEGKSACGSGCICHNGKASESNCGDGEDNDHDGLIDCADPDCLGQVCGLGNCGRSGPALLPDGGFPPEPVPDAGPDAGPTDAGPMDAGPIDAGTIDAGDLDAGPPDAGVADGGDLDAGAADAGTVDAGATDAGAVDAGAIDAGAIDAGPVDAGTIDAGPPIDAGTYCAVRETNCANGVDDDGDGLIDCADPDCLGAVCAANSGLGFCLNDGGCQ